MNGLDNQMYQRVLQELIDREKIEWTGQPNPGSYARRTLPTLLFGLVWTAFALFWIAGAAGFTLPQFSELADFMPLFGVPFVLLGIVLMIRPVREYFKAYRTVYVITNQRVLHLHYGKKKTITSFNRSDIKEVRRVERNDGSGNLSMRLDDQEGQKRWGRSLTFTGIRDVRVAESFLHRGRTPNA